MTDGPDMSPMSTAALQQPRMIINPELVEWGDAEGKNRYKAPLFNGTCPNCHRRQTYAATSWRPMAEATDRDSTNLLTRTVCGARDCHFVGDAWLTDAARLGQQYAQERDAGTRSPVLMIEPTGRDTAAVEQPADPWAVDAAIMEGISTAIIRAPVGVFDAEGKVGVFEPEGVAPFDPEAVRGRIRSFAPEEEPPAEPVAGSHEDDVAWAHRHLDIMAGRDVVLCNSDGSPRAIGILGQIEYVEYDFPDAVGERWRYKVNISEAGRGHLALWCRGIDRLRPGRDPFPLAA